MMFDDLDDYLSEQDPTACWPFGLEAGFDLAKEQRAQIAQDAHTKHARKKRIVGTDGHWRFEADPDPAEAAAVRVAFGTKQTKLKPAKQNSLFDPCPQKRMAFPIGKATDG